jgi:ferredoxin
MHCAASVNFCPAREFPVPASMKEAGVATRQIIHIDEERCTGCGDCVPACAEGALEVVDGKVRVVEEVLCDGLGACLGECPEGALTIEEREAPEFDEEAVGRRLLDLGRVAGEHSSGAIPSGCPGSLSMMLRSGGQPETDPGRPAESLLGNWPVQLGLVNPLAPFLRGADLLIAADCAPAAYRMFHEDFLEGRSLVIACPKLDDAGAHMEKLAEVFHTAQPRSVTVLHMEVPCCFGLSTLVARAAAMAGLDAPVEEAVISVRGERLGKHAEGPGRAG